MSIAKRLAIATLAASAAIPLAAHAGTFTTLYTFTGKADGSYPYGQLVNQGDAIYGVNVGNGGPDYGSAFEVNAASGHFTVLHTFQDGSDGAEPSGIVYQGGMIYGTTAWGGGTGCTSNNSIHGCGTIFSIDPKTQVETILYAFPQNDANYSTGPFAAAYLAGNVYGVTNSGGADGVGSIFSFGLATNSLSSLYSFTGATDGREPNPELLYQNGLFYGTTLSGGKGCRGFGGCGVVFSIDPSSGAESSLHTFDSKAGGHTPHSNLVYHGGSLIGDTLIGGNPACVRGCGVSFAIKASTGHEKVLETFTSRAESYSAEIIVGGSAYETIPGGGNGNGELLQVDLKSGQQTVIYTFTGGTDGSDPQAPLLYHDGAFYGTTDGGNGTVFKYVP